MDHPNSTNDNNTVSYLRIKKYCEDLIRNRKSIRIDKFTSDLYDPKILLF